VASGEYLVGSRDDGGSLFLIELAQFEVDGRGGALDRDKSLDERHRHRLVADGEKAQRPLRLSTPEPLGGDGDCAKTVFLDPLHAGSSVDRSIRTAQA